MPYTLKIPITSSKIIRAFNNPNNKKIFEYIKENPMSTVKDMCKEFGWDKAFVSNIIDDFKILDVVKFTKIGTSNLYEINKGEYRKFKKYIDRYDKIKTGLDKLIPSQLKAS